MDETTQLEFFDLPKSTAPRQKRGPIGNVQLRHDHAVLMTILCLIGLSVVFAMGVQRGKVMARAEQPLRIPSASALHASADRPAEPARLGPQETTAQKRQGALTDKSQPAQKTALSSEPSKTPRKAEKSVVQSSGGRFAIQVVTFSQPKRAHQELQRLKQQGEPAFLVMKQGKTALLVGPFPTRANASAKLASLKPKYQDCFLRSL